MDEMLNSDERAVFAAVRTLTEARPGRVGFAVAEIVKVSGPGGGRRPALVSLAHRGLLLSFEDNCFVRYSMPEEGRGDPVLAAARYLLALKLTSNPAAFNKSVTLAEFIFGGGLDGLTGKADVGPANTEILRARNEADAKAEREALRSYEEWLNERVINSRKSLARYEQELLDFNNGDLSGFYSQRKNARR